MKYINASLENLFEGLMVLFFLLRLSVNPFEKTGVEIKQKKKKERGAEKLEYMRSLLEKQSMHNGGKKKKWKKKKAHTLAKHVPEKKKRTQKKRELKKRQKTGIVE